MAESSDKDQHLQALMVRYQAGERLSFEHLFAELEPRIFQYLISKTWSRAQAEDLLQETFLQIHRSRATYQPGKPVLPWVFGIARYVFLMYLRSSKQERTRREDFESDALEALPVPPEVDRVFDRERIYRALKRLSPDQREPLLLHHVWGFSFREVAGLMGIGRSAAKVRAFRAMGELRSLLGSEVTESDSSAK